VERRQFLTTCAVVGGAGILAFDAARADTPPRLYSRVRLADVHGRPIRVRDLVTDTNYVFQYPFAATPCLLVRLSRPAAVAANLLDYDEADDGLYAFGTHGAEQFDAFFTKYRMKLALEYGSEGGRVPVNSTATLRELTNYCRTTIQC